MKRFWWGLGTGILVMLVLPLIVMASGLINMGATTKPGVVEKNFAALAIRSSMAWRAPEQKNPMAGDSQAVEQGLTSYAQMCARCHGGPGVEPGVFAKGLNPPAPQLDHAAEEFSQGELFWITKHGIRMTGMPAFGPTHQDEEIWKIVAFIKKVPELSQAQKEQLKEAAPTKHQHGSKHSEAGHHGERDEKNPDHNDYGSESEGQKQRTDEKSENAQKHGE